MARKLTPEQYQVLREAGTERAFTGKYWATKTESAYRCAGCGEELSPSDTKFDSRSGWPSFYQALEPERIEESRDVSHGHGPNRGDVPIAAGTSVICSTTAQPDRSRCIASIRLHSSWTRGVVHPVTGHSCRHLSSKSTNSSSCRPAGTSGSMRPVSIPSCSSWATEMPGNMRSTPLFHGSIAKWKISIPAARAEAASASKGFAPALGAETRRRL